MTVLALPVSLCSNFAPHVAIKVAIKYYLLLICFRYVMVGIYNYTYGQKKAGRIRVKPQHDNAKQFFVHNLLVIRPRALASYPGSGNTWLRYLLEVTSGIFTGSTWLRYLLEVTSGIFTGNTWLRYLLEVTSGIFTSNTWLRFLLEVTSGIFTGKQIS